MILQAINFKLEQGQPNNSREKENRWRLLPKAKNVQIVGQSDASKLT